MPDDSKVVALGEARRRREEDPNRVPCANCGKPIALSSTKCTHCGISFQGTAMEFAPGSAGRDLGADRRRRMVKGLALVLFTVFILGVALLR